MTRYEASKGHCVRIRDNGWNQSKSKVFRLISLETCEQICTNDNECEAYEEYPEYN